MPDKPTSETKQERFLHIQLSQAQEDALAAIDAGDFSPAALEMTKGYARTVFILQARAQDPAELNAIGGRGRALLLGVCTDKFTGLAGAAEAGAESADVGPDDPDEGQASAD